MKKKTIVIFPLTGLLALMAFKVADDIITRLGMRQAEAKQYIFGNIVEDFVYFPNGENGIAQHGDRFKIPTVKLLPEIVKGDKAGAAKELCAYVKMYCNSEDFMNDYNRLRKTFEPPRDTMEEAARAKRNATMLRSYKEQIPWQEKQLADAKKAKNTNSIALYEKSLADLRKSIAELEDVNPERTAWEKKYPANPSPFIKKRLEEYLSLVSTVDFSAQLVANNSNKVFVNPEYQKKSRKWKAIYRAGKEVNDVVTTFVKEWLKGDIIAAVKTKMPVDTDARPRSASNASSSSKSGVQDKPQATDSASTPKKKGFMGLKNKIKEVIKNN
jgi:hypothetical protein